MRRTWSDGKKQRLEDCLNRFVVGLVVAAQDKAKILAEREEWWRQLEEERQRRLEQRRREEERREVEQLEAWTEAWSKAQRIRRFLAAVRESSAQEVNAPPVMSLADWLPWAAGYADEIDPLCASAPPDQTAPDAR